MSFIIVEMRLGLFACALLPLAGCGQANTVGPCVPVQGKVTLDSKPLVGGWITFIPLEGEKSPRPEGQVDTEGNYALKTAGRAGAPMGKYRATLTISGLDKAQNSQFNPLYSHWDKSPLIVPVTENAPAGTYDLKLEPL